MNKTCFLSIVVWLSMSVYSQNSVFSFPFSQGSEEWVKFENIDNRIKALQIPEASLSKISTTDLLDICLSFPYITDILFADNYQEGFDFLRSEFNGFNEIMQRKDLVDVLIMKYDKLTDEMTDIGTLTSIEQGKYSFRYFVFEFILAQNSVIEQMDTVQTQKIFNLCLSSNNMKVKNASIFSSLNELPTELLFAKYAINNSDFLFKNPEQKEIVNKFIKNPILLDNETKEIINNYILTKFKD